MQEERTIDLIGAGLNNSLIAWFIRRRNPTIRVRIFEACSEILDDHTWSFHQSDLGNLFPEIAPLLAYQWNGYEVKFPKFQRTFSSLYASITPASLHAGLLKAGVEFYFSRAVTSIEPQHIVFANEEKIESQCVLDGRGCKLDYGSRLGFQKFVGLHLRLPKPHGLERPILMDAKVEQREGYRFIYVLPFSPTELLVEDTRYCSSAQINFSEFEAAIFAYCKQAGWQNGTVVRREHGVLPLPLDASEISSGQVPRTGMAGGFFHPVTGYSLPDGVRIADRISKLKDIHSKSVLDLLAAYREARASNQRYYQLLNRLMFLAAKPAKRYKIFEHFYELPEPIIQNFYSGCSTLVDRLLIFSGTPPVPVLRAMRAAVSSRQVAQ